MPSRKPLRAKDGKFVARADAANVEVHSGVKVRETETDHGDKIYTVSDENLGFLAQSGDKKTAIKKAKSALAKDCKKTTKALSWWGWFAGAIALATVTTGACSGCATDRPLLRGVATAHEVTSGVARVARAVCRPALRMCIVAKLNPCPALEQCQRQRRPVLRALDTAERSLLVALRALELRDDPTARRALAEAMHTAEQICAALAAWAPPPKVCSLVAGGAS